jgi:hypothetical protein
LQIEPSEHDQQAHIFEYAELLSGQYPELRLLNGSLNGVKLTIGQAVKAKKAGMKRGYPDIFLPVPRGQYHGLFIELKRKHSGQVSKEQKAWLEKLSGQGYYATVCKGADKAKVVIIRYLNNEI